LRTRRERAVVVRGRAPILEVATRVDSATFAHVERLALAEAKSGHAADALNHLRAYVKGPKVEARLAVGLHGSTRSDLG
jgi:hypothetical protein